MLEYWIWLSQRKNLSPRSKFAVLEHFGTPEMAFLADESELRLTPELREREYATLLDKDLGEAERILRDCDNKRISILTWSDAAYPNRLRNINNPPVVLYYEGSLPAVDHQIVIGMVGTRRASAYGLKHAKRLGYQLGRSGVIVVSGMAKGIDALSMEGALTAGQPVIGVLGCGTDVVYPKENAHLYEDVRRHGCLISEYPPGTPPLGEHFPIRNRIISGLSLGVLVVECSRASGALITAEHALEQGRDVFTIPGNLDVECVGGNLKLLKDGAYLVEDCLDVTRVYAGQFPEVVTDYIPDGYRMETVAALSAADDKKSVDKKKTGNYIDLDEILKDASPNEAAILRLLSQGPAHVDDIIDKTQIPAAQILSSITLLEIRRTLKRLPGPRYSLAEKD